MTGREPDREKQFREIIRLEGLAEQYRREQRKKRREAVRSSAAPAESQKVSKARRIWRRAKKYAGKKVRAAFRREAGTELDTGNARSRRKLYFRDEKIVVYTALFGAYDRLWEPMFHPENIDYVLLSDQPVPENSIWQPGEYEQLLPQEIREDPIRCNRWCKMHPHLLFPEYTYSIYVDANIRILSDLTPAAAGLDQYPAAMFRHKKRDCVYEEVQACIDQNKADPASLREHEKMIASYGVPRHWGLLEASIIARKHGDPLCVQLMEAWWKAFCAGSGRDQISLIGCLWKAGIEPSVIGTLGSNLQRCDLFLQMPHESSGRRHSAG